MNLYGFVDNDGVNDMDVLGLVMGDGKWIYFENENCCKTLATDENGSPYTKLVGDKLMVWANTWPHSQSWHQVFLGLGSTPTTSQWEPAENFSETANLPSPAPPVAGGSNIDGAKLLRAFAEAEARVGDFIEIGSKITVEVSIAIITCGASVEIRVVPKLIRWHRAMNAKYVYSGPPWRAVWRRTLRRAFDARKGEELHHWLIPQNGWGKYIPNYIKNQSWNLIKCCSREAHAAIDLEIKGFRFVRYPILKRILVAMPNGAKVVIFGGAPAVGAGASYLMSE